MTASIRFLASTVTLLAISAGGHAHAQTAGDVAAALRQITADRVVQRDITLADLGFPGSSILGSMDGRRDIYLPVPAGVPITDATIKVTGKYLRADGGRTTLLVSIDGNPVAAHAPDQKQGPIDMELAVDGSSRPSGFVRLNLAWSSVVGDNLCVDERSIGNVAEISATTRFSYRYDRDAIKDLAAAWAALPRSPAVLLARKKLSAETFDAAWRVSLALERAGKRPVVAVLPSIGDAVERADLKIPEGLQALPAFRNLTGAGMHTLQGAAEVGALLLVRSGALNADLVIADETLSGDIKAALDALSEQIAPLGNEAVAAYNEWRSQAFNLASNGAEGVRLSVLGGRQAITIAPAAAGKAAELFQSPWKKLPAGTASLALRTVEVPRADSDTVQIAQLGAESGSLDVLARADWIATLDLGSLGPAGTVPSRLDFDLSAAPGASESAPVASVFFNDHLLSASRLKADGAHERLSAAIPAYALAPRNVIRVTFQRQPSSDRCRETPQAFPAAVLPSSRIHFAKTSQQGDFLSAAPALARGATVVVPSRFLEDAVVSVPMVSRLAEAAGITPRQSATVVSDNEVAPKGPFLAIDTPVTGVETRLAIQGDRLVWKDKANEAILDVSGLKQIGVAELATSGSYSGILYRTVGPDPIATGSGFRLSRGDVAIIDRTGVISELTKGAPFTPAAAAASDSVLSWKAIKDDPWKLAAVASSTLAFFFVLLLVRAAAVRRRKS